MAEVEAGEVDQEVIEREARDMGWNPDFKGDKFISAAEFVERGKSILPIVQATNQRLRGELSAVEARSQAQAAELKALQAGQAALEEARDADLAEARAAAKAEAKAELARASADGDHAGVAEATARLTDLSAEDLQAAADAKAKKDVAREQDSSTGGRPALNPAVKAWLTENKDFAKDPEKIALANVIAARMRQAGDTRVGNEFLDDVANKVEQRLGGHGLPGKVEGGGGPGSRRSAQDGKSYQDLPPDAKAVCDRQAAKLVGPGRAHKDAASWQKAYATKYFAQG